MQVINTLASSATQKQVRFLIFNFLTDFMVLLVRVQDSEQKKLCGIIWNKLINVWKLFRANLKSIEAIQEFGISTGCLKAYQFFKDYKEDV